MEKIYSEEHSDCQLRKTRPEKIRFLMAFSKSLHIVRYGDMRFESSMN